MSELVSYDFIPHWNECRHSIKSLTQYSLENNRFVYLCNDGEGIVVNGEDNTVEVYGVTQALTHGKMITILK